jgi:hypothetical protein
MESIMPSDEEHDDLDDVGGPMSADWSGIALEGDPRMGEYQRDPAGYMEERAKTMRSGHFHEEEARLLRQKNDHLKSVLMSLLRLRFRT